MTRIDGRFVLEAEIGRGGMGVVYQARDEASGRRVALKRLNPGSTGTDRGRFEREAAVLSRLAHPNVVGYVAHGSGPEPYLAMRWLEGETLGARLARTGRLDVGAALNVASAAAAGLGAAHAAGVVHRDIKPDNLFLEGGDPERLVVIDFGIARSLSAGHTLTRAGAVVGTPFYMAPEQARADAAVDARTDVYALGAVLYHALSGAPPFRSDNLMAVLAAILMDPPRDIREAAPGLPDAVGALVMRSLAKEPHRRPADGAALADALRELGPGAQHGAPSLRPPAMTEREQRVLCLVLAAAPAIASSGATLAPGETDTAGRVRAAAEAHGGRIAVLADGSMVVRIGEADEASEQAVAAARCALAMQQLEPNLPLAVVAGRGHFRGPVPVGEVVERGAALVSLRGGHRRRPRVDADFAALLRGRVPVQRDEDGAWTLTAEPTADATRRLPFVGRAREVATLVALREEAFDEPVARVAVIGGPAGMGKSRLLDEVLLDDVRLDGVQTGAPHRVLAVRADPIAASAPFALAAQLVRASAQISEGDPLPARRDAVYALAVSVLEVERPNRAAGAEAMSARDTDRTAVKPSAGEPSTGEPGTGEPGTVEPSAVERLAMQLGELARVPMAAPGASVLLDEPTLRGDGMREAWLRWLGALLGQGPLTLALDDLQWADAPSLSLIEAGLRELADRPLLVLAAGRDELEARFGELWAAHEAQPMRLARLRKKASRALVRAALPDVGDDLVDRVVARGDGNPLFLEELAAALSGGSSEEALPTTVLGVVEARLATLPGPTRRILRAGSVYGRRFWSGAARELLGAERGPAMEAHLEALVERALIEASSTSRFAKEAEWTFRQALTRDASYAALTDEDRSLGHRLAARWLERAGVRDAAVLAEHHERGGDPDAAAVHHARAAEQALESDDLEAAIRSGERALSRQVGEHHASVRLTLASAYRWRARYAEALAHASEAARLLEAGSRARFRALGLVCAAAGPARDPGAARDALAQVREPAAPDAHGPRVIALCRAAAYALSIGDDEQVAGALDAARESLARCPGDDLARAWLRTLDASCARRAGDLGAFAEGTAEAADSYAAAGDERDACNQRVRLGNALVALGEPARAIEVLETALGSARRMGLRLIEGYALQNLGHALLRCATSTASASPASPPPDAAASQRRWLEQAADREGSCIALAKELGDGMLEAGSRLYLAEIAERRGDVERAIAEAQSACAMLGDVPGFRLVAAAQLASALLAAGRTEEARDVATRAHSGLAEEPVEEGEAAVWWSYARALERAGQREKAAETREQGRLRLEDRAERIAGSRWRRSFLEAQGDRRYRAQRAGGSPS